MTKAMTKVSALQQCRIVYVGDLSAGATGDMRMVSLRSLGFDVVAINSSIGRVTPLSHPFLYASIKLRRPLDPNRVNRQILSRLNECDILWIDKGVSIWPSTLKAVRARAPRVRIIGYSPDDMLNPNMSSAYFTATLPLYDSYLTTKSYGVSELKALGCRQVLFVENAYDPQAHRPIVSAKKTPPFSCDLGFIFPHGDADALCQKIVAMAKLLVGQREQIQLACRDRAADYCVNAAAAGIAVACKQIASRPCTAP